MVPTRGNFWTEIALRPAATASRRRWLFHRTELSAANEVGIRGAPAPVGISIIVTLFVSVRRELIR